VPNQSQFTNQTPGFSAQPPTNQIPVGQIQQLPPANQIPFGHPQQVPPANHMAGGVYPQSQIPNQQPVWFNPQNLPDGTLSGQPGPLYGQPLAGYVQTATTHVPPPQLSNQLTVQLTAQERAQQEAFNREMQNFNQVKFIFLNPLTIYGL
jgi:hypothetical protein